MLGAAVDAPIKVVVPKIPRLAGKDRPSTTCAIDEAGVHLPLETLRIADASLRIREPSHISEPHPTHSESGREMLTARGVFGEPSKKSNMDLEPLLALGWWDDQLDPLPTATL